MTNTDVKKELEKIKLVISNATSMMDTLDSEIECMVDELDDERSVISPTTGQVLERWMEETPEGELWSELSKRVNSIFNDLEDLFGVELADLVRHYEEVSDD